MRNYFIYNGIDTSDYGIEISGGGLYSAPTRDVTKISIPGRNGDLEIDNNRFNNILVTYPCSIVSDFQTQADAFRAALLQSSGYFRLEDSYRPDYFRLASYEGGMEPDVTALIRQGLFDVTFNCKPQLFLVSGETAQTITTTTTITNSTLFNARPLIRAYGTGSFFIGSTEVEITEENTAGYTDIDCDIQDCYCGTDNRNPYVSLSSFPVLEPGNTTIRLDGVTQLDLTPRWWTI